MLLQMRWPDDTLTFVAVDFTIMLVLTIFTIAGLAHVGTRKDVRGFLYICLGALLGSMVASIMRLRPSLVALRFIVPPFCARLANQYADELAQGEMETVSGEGLPSAPPKSKRADINLKAKTHVKIRGEAQPSKGILRVLLEDEQEDSMIGEQV